MFLYFSLLLLNLVVGMECYIFKISKSRFYSKKLNLTKQEINQIAMVNTIVIVKIMRNIYTDDDLLEEVSGYF